MEDRVTIIESLDDIKGAVDRVKKQKTLKKLLSDGFDLVKKRIEYKKALETNGFNTSKLDVDCMGNLGVDKLIETQLGGKRHGMMITWELNGKVIECDPYSLEVK